MKSNEEIFKVLNNYVYIIENYSKTKKLNIESKMMIQTEEESVSVNDASILSENKPALDLIKLNT